MSDVSVLRDKYRQEKQALWSHIEKSNASGRGLKRTLIRLAHLADALLIQLWSNAGFNQGEALIGVGGCIGLVARHSQYRGILRTQSQIGNLYWQLLGQWS